ncbi:MAG TPA: helix-turn-helix domain-containing protein [Candidatus Binataceae bacterium]
MKVTTGEQWTIETDYTRRPESRGEAWVYTISRAGAPWGMLIEERIRSRVLFESTAHDHARWDEAILPLEGRYWTRVGPWTRTLVPGEAALIPAGLGHESGIADNPTGVHFIVVLLSREHGCLREVEPGGVEIPPGAIAWLRAAMRMLRYGADEQSFIPLSVVPLFITSLASAPRLPADKSFPDAMVADLARQLDACEEIPSLTEMARRVGLGPTHLQKRFKAATGLSPLQYARSVRLDAIARALARGTTLPLVDLAAEQGFNDMKHFRSMFRRRFGISPAAYRKNHPPSASLIRQN